MKSCRFFSQHNKLLWFLLRIFARLKPHTMTQEVKYNGQTAIPDDYSAPDGDLEVSLNLIHEDGALKPIPKPDVMYEVGDGDRVRSLGDPRIVFIHKTANYTHYIQALTVEKEGVYQTDPPTFTNLMWIDDGSPNPNDIGDLDVEIKEVTAIGNTLCVLCEDAMYYYLWQNTNYVLLGSHLPELPISFSLDATADLGSEFEIANTPLGIPTFGGRGNVTLSESTNNSIIGKVNKYINTKSEEGKFIFPFLVRYAYRLYDQTLTMHSSPVLMITDSEVTPHLFVDERNPNTTTPGSTPRTYGKIGALLCDLLYKVIDADAITALSNWKDIVKTIDVFISSPIVTYNQNGTIKTLSWFSPSLRGVAVTDSRVYHSAFDIGDNYGICNGELELDLPRYDAAAVQKQIEECGTFYYLNSIKVEDLDTTQKTVPVPTNYLNNIMVREVMSDEFHSHDNIVPQRTFLYNNRLHLINIKRDLHDMLPPLYYAPYAAKEYTYDDTNQTYIDITEGFYIKAFVYLKDSSNNEIIKDYQIDSNYFLGYLQLYFPFVYFYYPDITAFKLHVEFYQYSDYTGQSYAFDLPLKPHERLNGAIFCEGLSVTDYVTKYATNDYIDSVTQTSWQYKYPNKVYASEVDNPFKYPATHVLSIGTSQVLNLATTTQPISEGQFGQYPLYCFTAEGIWAVSVNNDGTYRSIQPITRDVLAYPNSITPIDNAVLFAADRGIMLIAGGQTTCISDTIADQFPFDLARLPKLLQVFTNAVTLATFDEFLQGCQMIYDYTHQRIIVFNGTLLDDTDLENDRRKTYNKIVAYPYAYVYSLKSKKWGMMNSNIYAKVNSYPEALAITFPIKPLAVATVSTLSSDEPIGGDDDPPVEMPPSFLPATSDLVNFSAEIGETATIPTGLMVTRPLKLGASDTLKEIKTLIQRGFFARGEVATVLYGSRDLISWHLIGSSTDNFLRHIHGTGYKYFRIAAITNLTAEHSLHGASMEAKARHTDKLR